MGFTDAVRSAFSKSFTWQGRARRAEFWYFQLFALILIVPAALIDQSIAMPVFTLIAWLVLVLPSIALTVRRLHDTGRSGWWFWINLVPIVGSFILLAFMLIDGDREPNRYGASPKYALV